VALADANAMTERLKALENEIVALRQVTLIFLFFLGLGVGGEGF